jgi:hypothetical protein
MGIFLMLIPINPNKGGIVVLLTDNFMRQSGNYSELKNYRIRKEKVTNIYYRIYLESKGVLVRLDIEESESYLSFLVSNNTPKETIVYYGLSDYSDFPGKKRSIFESQTEKEAFVQGMRKHVKKYRGLFSSDKNGDGIVNHVYTFLNEFVKKHNNDM